jgi:hypothetical protein
MEAGVAGVKRREQHFDYDERNTITAQTFSDAIRTRTHHRDFGS